MEKIKLVTKRKRKKKSSQKIQWKEIDIGHAGFLEKIRIASIFYDKEEQKEVLVVWKTRGSSIRRARCQFIGLFTQEIKKIAVKIYEEL